MSDDLELETRISATLQPRLSWRQAVCCASDVMLIVRAELDAAVARAERAEALYEASLASERLLAKERNDYKDRAERAEALLREAEPYVSHADYNVLLGQRIHDALVAEREGGPA